MVRSVSIQDTESLPIVEMVEKVLSENIRENLSISNIANITGFNNTSFFYRSFKKQFDVTPSELRKNIK